MPQMECSATVAELRNDNWPAQQEIDELHKVQREVRFQKMLAGSKWNNPARNPINDAWADLLMNDETLHDLIKTTMQSTTASEEIANRKKACEAIFEAMEKTILEWAD